jgi:hypothetical protein
MAVMPAQAATNYMFSQNGSLPAGCTTTSSLTIFACGVLTLASGDTVSVGTDKPVTVTFSGAFTTADNLINEGGSPSDLNFNAVGAITLGDNSIVNANLTGSGAINIGTDSVLTGDINTTAGVITIGGGAEVIGSIITTAGGVTLGAGSEISGSISTGAGVITLLAGVGVGGNIATVAGGITVGNSSNIAGGVSSEGAGIIVITKNVTVSGDISTSVGSITIGGGSSVKNVSSDIGVLNIKNVFIDGNVTTSAAITLTGGNTVVLGNIEGGAAVTLSGKVSVSGSVYGVGALSLSGANIAGPVGHEKPLFSHFQIEHDGEGLTCANEQVTISACADTTCSTLYTDAIDVELFLNGEFNQNITVTDGTSAIGDLSVNFSYTNVGNITLSTNGLYVCKNGDSVSCDMVFANAGFIFLYGDTFPADIGNQISGVPFEPVMQLQAVKDDNGVCTGLFTGDVPVQLWQQNIIPNGITGLSFEVGESGTPIEKSSPTTSNITLDFGEDSKAIIPSPVYLDAGQIRLHAKYDIAGVELVGTSNDFWVSPDKLVVTATASDGSNINGNMDSSPIKHKAGQSFDFTIKAYNARGRTPTNVTANYTPTDLELLITRTGPTTGGFGGVFNYGSGTIDVSTSDPTYQNVTLTPFSDGVSFTDSAFYSEVGLLNLVLRDVDYGFANNIITAEVLNIGRFTPDHFEQSVIEQGSFGAVCNQNATTFAYTGQINGNDEGAISYFVSPVVELTAKNFQNVTTKNYTETGYNKFIAADDFIIVPATDSDIKGQDTNYLPLTANIFSGTLSHDGLKTNRDDYGVTLEAGILHYELSDEDNFFYPRNENSEVIAQNNNIDLLIDQVNFVDSDGIGITSPNDITNITGINLRFGLASIENSFGPETENLPQNLLIKYLNASGRYVVNEDDSCTTYDASNVELTSGTLSKDLTSIALSKYSTSINDLTGQVENGATQSMALSAPGPGNQGTINIIYLIDSWLEYNMNDLDAILFDENPSATATFGLFRGNDRIIYRREIDH